MKSNSLLLLIVFLFSACISQPSDNQFSRKDVEIFKVCDLPDEAIESSGIIFFQGLLWTINDSGNEPVLYAIDTFSGKLLKEIHVEGAENVDWEALSQDDKNIYIADNGNNSRARNNYSIYVLAKDSILNYQEQIIKPFKIINYNYREADLSDLDLNHINVDSEAILVDGDSIFIYIKDWLFSDMSAFSISLNGKNDIGTIGSKYNLGFAATAATRINEDMIAFLGYRDYRSYLTILKTNPHLTGKVEEIAHFELYDLQGYQTEGLTYEDGKLYISCENQVIKQALFRVEFE